MRDIPYDQCIYCYQCKNMKTDHAKRVWSQGGNKFCMVYRDYVPIEAMWFIRTMGCKFFDKVQEEE